MSEREGDGEMAAPRDDEGYVYDVFISYRWVEPDKEWVRKQLAPCLVRAGLRVCLDVEDFGFGRDLLEEMRRANKQSRFVLSVLSPDYFAGKGTAVFEAVVARLEGVHGAAHRLIPLVLRPVDMPSWLQNLVSVDWTQPEDHEMAWRRLLTSLGASNSSATRPLPVQSIRPTSRWSAKKVAAASLLILAIGITCTIGPTKLWNRKTSTDSIEVLALDSSTAITLLNRGHESVIVGDLLIESKEPGLDFRAVVSLQRVVAKGEVLKFPLRGLPSGGALLKIPKVGREAFARQLGSSFVFFLPSSEELKAYLEGNPESDPYRAEAKLTIFGPQGAAVHPIEFEVLGLPVGNEQPRTN